MNILSHIRKFRQRQRLMGSMGWMLQREDDHFLQDIGLTRADLLAMLRDPPGQVEARSLPKVRQLARP